MFLDHQTGSMEVAEKAGLIVSNALSTSLGTICDSFAAIVSRAFDVDVRMMLVDSKPECAK